MNYRHIGSNVIHLAIMRVRLLPLIAATSLAVVIAGCGSTASIHQTRPQSKPTTTAKAKTTPSPTPAPSTVSATAPINCNALPPTTVSLKTATSNSYTFKVGSIPLPKGAPALLAGNTPLNNPKHLPPVWIVPNWESYIPRVRVVNDTHGAVSNCTAQEWAYGLLKMVALSDWASEWDAPQLLQATAGHSGTAPEFYGGSQGVSPLFAGDRQTVTGGIWPTKLILVQLTPAEQQDQATTSKFAFIFVSLPNGTAVTTTTTPSGQTSQSRSSAAGNGGGILAAGTYESNYTAVGTWPFGPVFLPTSWQGCSADGVTSVVCGAAGVS